MKVHVRPNGDTPQSPTPNTIEKLHLCTRLFSYERKFYTWIKNNILLMMTILSVFVGLGLGIVLRNFHISSTAEKIIAFPGEIFMQMLKLLILPLIVFSLVSSVAQMDPKKSGRMGAMAVGYYITTVTLATILHIFSVATTLVLLIHPGNPKIKGNHMVNLTDANISPLNSIMDLIRNMFPDNVIRATFQKIQSSSNSSSSGEGTEYIWGMNVLGIIVFCSALGISLSQIGEKAKYVVNIFVILERAVMNLIKAAMWFAPVGIISLIAGNLLELDDLGKTAEGLIFYLVTILSGLMVHWLITTPVLYRVDEKRPKF